MVAVEEVPLRDTARYGVVDVGGASGRLSRIASIVEKPVPEEAPSNLAVVGRYVFDASIMGILGATPPGAGGEIQLTDAIAELAGSGPVLAARFRGERHDCGNRAGWLRATVALAPRGRPARGSLSPGPRVAPRGLARFGRSGAVKRYSAFALARNALRFGPGWQALWRSPEPAASYDVVIVGGGGHGLATAYYLASEHGIDNVAVLEKGWIGGGNTGRNTTIVRSNYLWDEAAALYEKSLQLFEGLSQELNYNVMFSQRGVFNLGHSVTRCATSRAG